jgi:hypothetical protein
VPLFSLYKSTFFNTTVKSRQEDTLHPFLHNSIRFLILCILL